MLILLFACTGADIDTAAPEGSDDTAHTAASLGEAPVIDALVVIWDELSPGEFQMYADATVSDAEGDLVDGVAKFDVATGAGQPMGFEYPIRACADVRGACWTAPTLIIEIPEVITTNDYTVELWVIDAAGNVSGAAAGFLQGG
ncbi:MAG: hypothetical protein EXR71_07675 [Myxococcales bacterium]|nr:hypothetical protein [Myxococcales bacterium]